MSRARAAVALVAASAVTVRMTDRDQARPAASDPELDAFGMGGRHAGADERPMSRGEERTERGCGTRPRHSDNRW
jgi:hypothetical protein